MTNANVDAEPGRRLGLRILVLVVISALALVVLVAFALDHNEPAPQTASPAPAQLQSGAQAAPTNIKLTNYQAIQSGMSYDQVANVLGSPGQELSASEVGGVHSRALVWSTPDGFGNITALFQNDRLITKANVGLR